ncbi:hypothetical protein CSUI_002863 [Cystoisospora suis]|uniref:Transmembrane protein n=1 Tax=Cystoisospora suis TaxID=483139 RepID=A0A2C6KSF8_9APIC|nr:hypothetical protein CSUI_002863 [Cystoisospora suis]
MSEGQYNNATLALTSQSVALRGPGRLRPANFRSVYGRSCGSRRSPTVLNAASRETMPLCGLAASVCGHAFLLCLAFFVLASSMQVARAEPDRSALHAALDSAEAVGRDSRQGATGPFRNQHEDYTDYAAQLLGWERLQSAVHNLQDFSLQGLQKNAEGINLYSTLQERLDKIRNRLTAAGLLEDPPASREELPSATHRDHGRAAAGESVAAVNFPGEADSEMLSGWPLEGLITALPAQIQEQIKKNLEIEQAILEQKLLMQQLALSKQIEEFRKEVGIDEWLELWSQLGSQVSDNAPPPEEPKVDSEAAELLDALVSKFPQLFTEPDGIQAEMPSPVRHKAVDGQPVSVDNQEKPQVLPKRTYATQENNQRRSESAGEHDKMQPAAGPSPTDSKNAPPPATLPRVQGVSYSATGAPSGRPGSGTTGGIDRAVAVTDVRSPVVSQSSDRLQNFQGAPFLSPPLPSSRNENGLLKVRPHHFFLDSTRNHGSHMSQLPLWQKTIFPPVSTLRRRWFGLQALEHQAKVSKDNLVAPAVRGTLDPRAATTDSPAKGVPPAAGGGAFPDGSLNLVRDTKEQAGVGIKPEVLKNGPLLTLVKTLRDMLALS